MTDAVTPEPARFVILDADGRVAEQVFVPDGETPAGLGQLPDGCTEHAVARFGEAWETFDPETGWQADLVALRAIKWAAIKAQREARRLVIATEHGPFDADETAKTSLLGKLQSFAILGDAAPESVTWKLHDNSFVTLTRADFETAAMAVLGGIEAIYAHSFLLEAMLAAADSAEAIDAIDVETGWPD